MKTKFILHGGGLSHNNPHNDTFFREFTKDLNNSDKVLFVGLARRDEADRLSIYERDKGYILAQTDKNIVVENAELDTIAEQAKTADAIFITGGNTGELANDLRGNEAFFEAIKGKVVAGSSAGAYILSAYYFTNSLGTVVEGFGCAPIRVACHHESESHPMAEGIDVVAELEKVDNSLELVLLRDCEWVVKEIGL